MKRLIFGTASKAGGLDYLLHVPLRMVVERF